MPETRKYTVADLFAGVGVLTDPTQKDKLSRIAVSLFGVPKREARRIIAKYQAQ